MELLKKDMAIKARDFEDCPYCEWNDDGPATTDEREKTEKKIETSMMNGECCVVSVK